MQSCLLTLQCQCLAWLCSLLQAAEVRLRSTWHSRHTTGLTAKTLDSVYTPFIIALAAMCYCVYTVQKNAGDVPKPCFFPLVFTDINGKHNYAGCLTFYEPVPEPDVRRLVKFVRRAVGLGERRKVSCLPCY
jgi:hypothetical protein